MVGGQYLWAKTHPAPPPGEAHRADYSPPQVAGAVSLCEAKRAQAERVPGAAARAGVVAAALLLPAQKRAAGVEPAEEVCEGFRFRLLEAAFGLKVQGAVREKARSGGGVLVLRHESARGSPRAAWEYAPPRS